MAQTIKLKRSSVSGNVPSTAQLELGELAINTHDGKVFIKKDDGTASIVEVGALSPTASVYSKYSYTATASQTTFSGTDDNSNSLSYYPGYAEVYLNGVKLLDTTEYTATNGSSIVLAAGASANDVLEVIAMGSGSLEQLIVTRGFDSFIYTATASQTTFSGTDDNSNSLSYTANQIQVFLNGVLLDPSDYTASNGTSVVISSGTAANDIVTILAYNVDSLDSIGNLSVTGTVTASGGNSTNWNTAYGWGDHSAAGYVTNLSSFTTTDLAEGTNLYYTDERVDDRVNALIVPGLGVTTDYDDINNELTIESDTIEESCKNGTGSTILKGTPVYQTGTSGNFMEIAPADASSAATMPAVGVLGEDLTAGAEGTLLLMGRISGLNTSAFSEGDVIYVASGGGYTNTRPTGQSVLVQNLGRVTKVDASNGGGVVMGSGRSNDVPNLTDGNVFIGNASGTYDKRAIVTADISDLTATATELNYTDGVTSNIQTQLDSKAPLASPTFTGTVTIPAATVTGDVSFGDNDKAIFGAGSDLQIYHDGSSSFITDAGTGNLRLQGTNLALQNADGTKNYFLGIDGGAAALYFNNSNKIQTVSTGIDVTGNILVSGTVDGRDVATDGTKLDGIESGATADQTAAEILTAINTVDGAGSGLDADLLDGQHGSYYTSYTDTAISNLVDTAPSTLDTLNELAAALGDDANFSTTVTNSIATKVSKSGDTITSGTSIGLTINHDTFGQGLVIHRNDSANGASIVFKNNALQQGILFGNSAGSISWRPLSTTNNYILWHQGNDGAGSGLDADLLDGQQGTYYAAASSLSNYLPLTGGTLSGDLAVNGGALTVGNGTYNIAISTDQTGSGQSVGHTATVNEGIFWHTNNTDYAIYRTSGTWLSPNYQQLRIDWPTGIELNGGGTSYGKSGVNILGGNLQIDGTTIVDASRNLTNIATATTTDLNVSGNTFLGYATLTADSQNDVVLFSSNGSAAQSGAFHNKLIIKGGASQTRDLQLYQEVGGYAWLDTSYSSNSLNISSTFTALNVNTALNVTGTATLSGSLYLTDTNTRISEGSANSVRITTNSGWVDIGAQNTSWAHIQTDRSKFYFDKDAHFDGQIYNYVGGGTTDPYWRAGNDGAGSGLDADLLDGVQGSSYLRSDADDNATGLITLNGAISAGSAAKLQVNGFQRTGPIMLAQGLTSTTSFNNTNERWFLNDGSNVYASTLGTAYNNKIWTDGNDGAGSGLDADLLDGNQATAFAKTTAITNINMNNFDITNLNALSFNDPGPNEGISWVGGSLWKIYESPNDLTTNIGGNLQFVTNTTRRMTLDTSGNLEVTGSLTATTKSFVIDHPTKPDMKLRYGSLEGPENGVYVRGRLNHNNVIELPDYWTGLVDEDTITVNLTAIGRGQDLWVEDIADNKVIVGGENVNCFYTVFAERKDVERFEVEY